MTWLGLCSFNLQLPLLVVSPEKHRSYFCPWASGSIQLCLVCSGLLLSSDVCASLHSKELLFRKQRPQFATCLEAAAAMQLLNLSAAFKCSLGCPAAHQSTKQHQGEEKGPAASSTACLDPQQLEIPRGVDINMKFEFLCPFSVPSSSSSAFWQPLLSGLMLFWAPPQPLLFWGQF